jgi:trimethylamine monooxygenase
VKSYIQFLKAVKNVKFLAEENQFEVVVRDLEKNCLLREEKFDFVVVCSGHFSVPNVPEFKGLVRMCQKFDLSYKCYIFFSLLII